MVQDVRPADHVEAAWELPQQRLPVLGVGPVQPPDGQRGRRRGVQGGVAVQEGQDCQGWTRMVAVGQASQWNTTPQEPNRNQQTRRILNLSLASFLTHTTPTQYTTQLNVRRNAHTTAGHSTTHKKLRASKTKTECRKRPHIYTFSETDWYDAVGSGTENLLGGGRA